LLLYFVIFADVAQCRLMITAVRLQRYLLKVRESSHRIYMSNVCNKYLDAEFTNALFVNYHRFFVSILPVF
jgi:hypothetical protein